MVLLSSYVRYFHVRYFLHPGLMIMLYFIHEISGWFSLLCIKENPFSRKGLRRHHAFYPYTQ